MCEIEPKPLGALCKKISTKKSVKKIAIFFGSGRMGSFPATSWRERMESSTEKTLRWNTIVMGDFLSVSHECHQYQFLRDAM
jgi:hypothetical protein